MKSKYTVGALMMMLQRIQDHIDNITIPANVSPDNKEGLINTRDNILKKVNKEIEDLKEDLNK